MSESNPYRAPVAEIADFRDGNELELAGLGHRFGAFLIDTVIMVAILLPLFVSDTLDFAVRDQNSFAASLVQGLIGFSIFAVVQSWFLKRNGQTIGKKLVGIRIVNLAGNAPGLWRLLSRRYSVIYLFNLLPAAWALLGLLDFLFIFRADRRCLHDLTAGTRVVMHGAKHSSATWFVTPLVIAVALGIGAAIIGPMIESGRLHKHPPKPAPKPAHHTAAPAHPAQAPSHSQPQPAQKTQPAQARPAAARPAAAPQPAPPSPLAHTADPAANQPDPAPAVAAAEPSPQELRKCAALQDAAAIIRCSQGGGLPRDKKAGAH